jgi:hypothetical protein
MLLAAASPRLELRAITTVAGNGAGPPLHARGEKTDRGRRPDGTVRIRSVGLALLAPERLPSTQRGGEAAGHGHRTTDSRAHARERVVMTVAQRPADRTQWTVTTAGTVAEVTSRATAWAAATAAYAAGVPVVVKSHVMPGAPSHGGRVGHVDGGDELRGPREEARSSPRAIDHKRTGGSSPGPVSASLRAAGPSAARSTIRR